jgi:hypothetical protein
VFGLASPVLGDDDMYGGGFPPQPRLQPTFRADDFSESLGLSAAICQEFLDLGIRYYRAALWDTRKGRQAVPARAAEMSAAWEKYGVRPMLLVDSLRDKPEQTLAMIKQYPQGLVAEIEGGNEVNNKFPPQVLNTRYKGKTDEAGGAAFMDDLFRLLHADPATKDIPVVSFTAIFSDNRLAKPHTSFDFGNIHSYQGSRVPSSSLEMNFTRLNNILPVGAVIKPFTPTECGYNVEADKSNGTGLTGSLQAQAQSIPMIFAEYFRHGIPRTYLFALHNADGYGLLESDHKTKRPSYFAVKSLVAAITDAKWNPQSRKWEGGKDFTPRALLFDLPDAPHSVHTLVLQKASGEYNLLIWNEVENYDQAAKRDRANRPVPVTVQFQTPVQNQATLLTPNAAGEYVTTTAQVADGKLLLQVPSTVMIVRLMPASKESPAEIAAPAQLDGVASENEAKIHWQAVAGAAGYFVFRNGWHIATTTATEYVDESSWLRPGLGYTYQVQAFAASGAMSPRTERVVQTAARFPDLITTEFDLEKADVVAGNPVRATAKIKNIGAGSTPNKIGISASWHIDGKLVGWSTFTGPLKSGEERTLISNGGGPQAGQWTAVAGTHVLKCVLDDINRLPGEYKGNNVSDRTIVVGAKPKGRLLGSTAAAPGVVDLAREGTLDWVHWGLSDKNSINRMAGVHLIDATLTKEGKGYCDRTLGCPVSINWTGGSPTAAVRNSHAGLWWNFPGTSQNFSAPADTTERVLKVYVSGIEGAGATLTATLSDDSAPAYVSSAWNGNAAFVWAAVPDGFSAVYTIRYRAASAGQKLAVQWKLTTEPNRFLGQARLQAAALSTD